MQLATRVVNIRRERCTVYVGRARRGQRPSRWGNPFELGAKLSNQQAELLDHHPILETVPVGTTIVRDIAIKLYRAMLEKSIESGKLNRQHFMAIYGETLGCFCAPQPCHADIIAIFCQWFADNPKETGAPPEHWLPPTNEQAPRLL